MTSKKLTLSLLAASALFSTTSIADEVTLDPIVVSSDFREAKLSKTTNSVTVIGEDEIYDKASQPFIETLASTPNVNFTAGASKAKYIQIRGIGERSQFETPLNPSVGLIVDGIDFSSMALGVSMFDVKQIEVLRGPQGTTFGANALAGVITVQSNELTKETEGRVEATVGNYNTQAYGVVVGGTLLEDTLLGRLSVYKNTSDGYMKNSFLKRDDTNNIDELSVKAQLKWMVADNHTVDLNFMHVNVDNGYDAFNFYNTRTSISDEPGEDTQKTNALAIKSIYDLPTMQIITRLSYSKSDMTYSYDEDWSFPAYHPWAWKGSDEYIRDKKQADLDVRVVSSQDSKIFNGTTDWTFGVYYKDYSDDLERNHIFVDLADNNTIYNSPYKGDYRTQNKAIYGQLDSHISNKLTFITGLRIEKIDAEYNDSNNFYVKTDETLVGGKVGLNYQMNDNMLYYATLSRGYKPGGVNANNEIPSSAREFKTETLWNIDLGLNSSHVNNTLISRLNLFYGKRIDQQVKSSFITNIQGGGAQFNEYFANAAKANYYGLESQVDYYPEDNIHLFSSIGLLKAEFDEYIDPNPTSVDVNGRAPAQSPEYQYTVGMDISFAENWNFAVEVEGRGSYYFSNRHNEKSTSYQLMNARVAYFSENWSATLWGKNLSNVDYQTRGFGSFPNNPDNFYEDVELYTQQGAPRTFGLTVSYDF